MSDVRSMLRAERASRRITHPHASYTSDGKLLCNLCETLVKSEAQWQGHLHSTQHGLRSQRATEAAAARKQDNGSKKRKASTVESPTHEDRKKARAMDPADVEEQEEELSQEKGLDDAEANATATAEDTTDGATALSNEQAPEAEQESVDETELARFEREMAALEEPQQPTRPSALNSSATISAAPLTAEELAAQAREEHSEQRGKRDAEIQGEKEDAARVLEEEMEEMEGLEERVKRLREKREALRKERSAEESNAKGEQTKDVADKEAKDAKSAAQSEDEEDSDDDEDFDDWRFGRT